MYGNEDSDFLSNFENTYITIRARNCVEGESYDTELTCTPCKAGFRRYTALQAPGDCEPCLEHEICHGSTITYPMPKYWRSSDTTTDFIECFNPDACLGGDELSPHGICEHGYQGVLCASCIENYYASDNFECFECPSSVGTILIFFFLCLALVCVIVMFIKINMKMADVENYERPLTSVYIKIFFNHYQMI